MGQYGILQKCKYSVAEYLFILLNLMRVVPHTVLYVYIRSMVWYGTQRQFVI